MTSEKRPVYILGAGFSKAINSAMPISFELGQILRNDFPDEFTAYPKNQTFESWLSALSSPLPFLKEHELLERRAKSAVITQTIGDYLDKVSDTVSSEPAPPWLIDLVKIWHLQRAVVITFNYDLLVERAIQHAQLCELKNQTRAITGIDLAVPSPTREHLPRMDAIGGQIFSDQSFQIIKLHGSLNWYRTKGAPWDATSISAFDHQSFGIPTRDNWKGPSRQYRNLVRNIVPPVSDKSSHYNSNLTFALWEEARHALADASKLTLIGYSAPIEDVVTNELLRFTSEATEVEIVDKTPGSPDDPQSLISRTRQWNSNASMRFSGSDAIPQFVDFLLDEVAAESLCQDCLEERFPDLESTPIFTLSNLESFSFEQERLDPPEVPPSPDWFGLSWDHESTAFQLIAIQGPLVHLFDPSLITTTDFLSTVSEDQNLPVTYRDQRFSLRVIGLSQSPDPAMTHLVMVHHLGLQPR